MESKVRYLVFYLSELSINKYLSSEYVFFSMFTNFTCFDDKVTKCV